MLTRDMLYVGGAWVPPVGTGTIEVVDSTTEEVMGVVPAGEPDDAARAVAAARDAFGAWSRVPVQERAGYVQRISEGLAARLAEIGDLVAGEVGMPLNLATVVQGGLPVAVAGSMAQIALSMPAEERVGNSLVVREPVGVVAAITPWNYPLHQVVAKVAPALAAGCTVVVKPSELAPLTAFLLAEVMDEAGLPPGVCNLVTGLGPVVGEALATSPGVDMVSFTGSTAAGRRVAALAAGSVKRVALELGGKSPAVILGDADLGRAVTGVVTAAFLNAGQTCSALTRMLVPRPLLAQVEALAAQVAASYTVGDPRVEGTRMGPLVSAAQRERVRAYIRRGVHDGARLVAGGPEVPTGADGAPLDRGFFVRPTVLSDVANDMAVAREEIFGPVLCILAYDSEEQAVDMANDTMYGLAAAVWSGDADRALGVARRLRAGQVEVNGGTFNPLAPFGGYKQSGNGRELGRQGLEEYLEVKSIQL